MNNRLINTKVAGGGGCTDIVDNYDPFGGNGVALYQLNGNANDVSGNYNGTASNVTYGTGVFGQAGVFNGSSSRIDLPSLGGISPSSDFTISCWVNAGNQSGGDNTIVTIWDNTNLELRVDESLSNTVRVVYYSGGFAGVNSSFTLTENEWTHITVTYKFGIGFTFYKNSISSQLYSFTGTLGTTAGTNKIGQYSGDNINAYFIGSIDQVRIFNKALNSTEVTTLYNETACASHINLDRDPVRHWGLDNTLASTKSGYSALQKTTATYSTGRFGAALNFAKGNTASETSTSFGDIWTEMTKSNFAQGSFSLWFKPDNINARNIILYNEKCPWLQVELASDNQIYIGPDTGPILSGTTFNTNDTVFVCGSAVRTGGTGNIQTVSATMYFGTAGGTLQSVSGSSTHTESTYINTMCLGHGSSGVGFGGWIDQFRLFDKPLNAEQAQALFDEAPY